MLRGDFVRRRIAPIAFGVVIALMARESCQKQQRTHATIALDFGSAASSVRAVDADVILDGETLATFHRAALPNDGIGPCRFPTALPADDGELDIVIDLGASQRKIVRRFHASEGATITIPLADELR